MLETPIAPANSGVNPNYITFFLTVSAFFIGICGLLFAFAGSSIVIMAVTLLIVSLCVWRIRQIIKSS